MSELGHGAVRHAGGGRAVWTRAFSLGNGAYDAWSFVGFGGRRMNGTDERIVKQMRLAILEAYGTLGLE
jgi:hypothetical protein